MSNNVKSSRTMWDPIMLTCLHPSNQGPDVGKFKSEFPSDISLVSRTTCRRLDVVLKL